MRRHAISAMVLTVALLATAGCEEGLPPPVIGNPGGGTQTVTLVQTSVAPSRGDPVTFQATVTLDGVPQNNVVVTFTTDPDGDGDPSDGSPLPDADSNGLVELGTQPLGRLFDPPGVDRTIGEFLENVGDQVERMRNVIDVEPGVDAQQTGVVQRQCVTGNAVAEAMFLTQNLKKPAAHVLAQQHVERLF